MKRLGLWLVALSVASATPAFAQRTSISKTNVEALQQISTAAAKDYKANRAQAIKLAKERGWVIEKTYANGSHVSLQGLDSKGLPIYYITYNNSRAAATTKTDQLWAGGSLGLTLSGSSNAVNEKLGVWDGGRVRDSHQELKSRVIQKDNATQVSDHATHVAGTMIASGVSPVAKGMAYGVKKLQAYDFNGDVAEMAQAAPNLLVSNHSYGTIAGWRYNSDRKGTPTDPFWEWWGDSDISEFEDYKFGYYNDAAAKWDQIAYNAPNYLIVKSSGNNRNEGGPNPGQPYFKRKSNGSFELVSGRNGISNNNSYDIISTYGTAKNILTVGAVQPIPYGYENTTDVVISTFSSYGPTDDGRIKPDIVGNGVSLLSSTGSNNQAYQVMSGTSMAAPNISGSLLLLQEHYSNLNAGKVMRAATLKGLVIHTADEAGTSSGPDYIYGWGLLNAERAAKVISNSRSTNIIAERSLAQGEEYTLNVVASGAGPLVVTISWTDPEANPLPVNTDVLNNRTPRLVNDLDLRVVGGSTTFLPWTLNPANPSSPAVPSDNILDNVEQILIQDAVPGSAYTIKVKHKGNLSKGPQHYSLLASGIGGAVYCTSTPLSNQGSKISSFKFGSDALDFDNTCTSFTDLTGKVLSIEAGESKALVLTTGSCNGNNTTPKSVKIFADWNNDGDFTDSGETLTSGAVNASGSFSANITAPGTVSVGDKTRLRVVLQETADASSISSCANYNAGETQDYVLMLEKPRADVAIVDVSPIGSNLCATSTQKIAVKLRNFGSATQNNIPLNVIVKKNGVAFTQLSTTILSNLLPNRGSEFVINNTFATELGATYELIASATLPSDANATNNTAIYRFTVSEGSQTAPTASINRCGTESNYSLTGSGNGTIFWYNSLTDTKPIAAGNQLQIAPNLLTSNSLFVGLNDLDTYVGPVSKSAIQGQGDYGQFTPDVLITAKAPMVLETAKLYIGHGGKITFTLMSMSGQPISFRTIDVAPTRSTPATGTVADDPNDQGREYYIGLEIPAAGDYKISISYEDGATIYRNRDATVNYPVQLPGVFAVTGNTASPNSTSYYYYFYNIRIKALGCKSERVEVEVQGKNPIDKAVITREGQTLKSNSIEGNQWFLNGSPIAGATGQTLIPTESGDYSLMVSLNGCISRMADVYSFVARPGLSNLGNDIIVYPNPNDGTFYIGAELNPTDVVKFELYNMLGDILETGEIKNHNGLYERSIDLTSKASGIYFVRVYRDQNVKVHKIVVQK